MRSDRGVNWGWAVALVGMVLATGVEAEEASPLTAGSVYREYRIDPKTVQAGWRVTSPTATRHAEARSFLPNPVFSIEGVDMKHAISAEVEIDFWSGHHGTRGKQVRINDSGWINLRERLAGTRGFAGDYLAQYNIRMQLPLKLLQEGSNTVEGTCRNNEWGWGQWGWYCIILRIFYDPDKVEHPEIDFALPGDGEWGEKAFGEDPTFRMKPASAVGIRQVDLLGAYNDVDENGDGLYEDFHGMQRLGGLEGHIGTTTEAPWEITWDTTWVPDQKAGAITLLPRICDTNGVWTVGNPIEGCSLIRTGHSVRLVKSMIQPVLFWVRAGQATSCVVDIDDKETPMDRITSAKMYLRSWNAENNEEGHTPFRVNCSPWMNHVTGPSHDFHAAYYDIPVEHLQPRSNTLTFTSSTRHHGCEFLWPGPDVLLRIETPTSN